MIRLPYEILTALETILDYYWNDEERHYEETPEEDRDDHIFTSLKIMRAFVNSDDIVAVHSSDQSPQTSRGRAAKILLHQLINALRKE